MVIKLKRMIGCLFLLFLVIVGIIAIPRCIIFFDRQNYPQNYSEYVEKYAKEYNVDPNMLYAVIKTESGFRADATSDVGARGLTQIMEDTFYWERSKLNDDKTQFDDMYQPEKNIQYGAYLLSTLYQQFGSYRSAIAAYHAGRTAVSKWLSDSKYSYDQKTLSKIPIRDTAHYVEKVTNCYKAYCRLYASK